MQFADFISCGFDQLVNVAAKMHFRQGLAVPMVIRLPSGGGFSGGPVPLTEPGGVVPAGARPEGRRAGDRRRRQGPADGGDPRSEPGLLPRAQGPLPERSRRGSRGRARRPDRRGARRPRGRGDDRDRLRLGRRLAERAAEELGESIEIIDLRSLVPLDAEAIERSARKHGQGAGRARGDALGRGRIRGRGDRQPTAASSTSTRRQAAHRPRHADPVQPAARAGGPAPARGHEGGVP